MEITWLGTAGFDISTNDSRFLIDPFVSRNPEAEPVQPKRPADLAGADRIFVSHGHFDHLMDLPEILGQDPENPVRVFCSATAAKTLEKMGVPSTRIFRVTWDSTIVRFDQVAARACFGRHIRFDLSLVAATLARMQLRFFHILPLFTRYPCGRVLSWQFSLEGRTIQHLGSAGIPPGGLERLKPADVLMLPLEGHSDICRIAADLVMRLAPRSVIVHHHDNFYPPVSRTVDIAPFVEQVNRQRPDTRIIVPRINTPFFL
ncbi:MAG TPA: MBL fold metallo-hydrolase [Desulfotignum sp.]|nr:MBL fold metallo-hydrolase [Desulfotignum sp.]